MEIFVLNIMVVEQHLFIVVNKVIKERVSS
jgi:hypothetical protein